MDIVKKFQLVLYGETVEVFDRLFDIADEEDKETRFARCGDLMEYMLSEYDMPDVMRVMVSAGNVAKRDKREDRFDCVKNFIKQLITEEVQAYILEKNQDEEQVFELLREE